MLVGGFITFDSVDSLGFSCSDTICDLGGSQELANYGEYSGAPSESQTFEYAKTILGLMTKGEKHPQGDVLCVAKHLRVLI